MNTVEQWADWKKRNEAALAVSNNFYIDQFRKSKAENDQFWQNLGKCDGRSFEVTMVHE